LKRRIYKGEGTLEFTCFSSYSSSRVAFLDEPIEKIIKNKNNSLIFVSEGEEGGKITLEDFYNYYEWRGVSNLRKKTHEENGEERFIYNTFCSYNKQ
jgi:hypothetical protein